MNENEYKKTFFNINERRCVYEKTINSRQGNCDVAQRFNLADREGVNCTSAEANAVCKTILDHIRHKASFALHLSKIDTPLPHAKETKVQMGGLLGLQHLLYPERSGCETIENITTLLYQARQHYHGSENLPYTELIKSIVKFTGRKKRSPADKW